MDKNLIEKFSPIDAIYLSKSFCEMMTSQSCDCDSIVIKSGDKYILLNYFNRDDDGYIEWDNLPSFDTDTYQIRLGLHEQIVRACAAVNTKLR